MKRIEAAPHPPISPLLPLSQLLYQIYYIKLRIVGGRGARSLERGWHWGGLTPVFNLVYLSSMCNFIHYRYSFQIQLVIN